MGRIKNKLIATLAAVGMGLGVFVGTAGATSTYGGITYDAKEPYKAFHCRVDGQVVFSGTVTYTSGYQVAASLNRIHNGVRRVIARQYFTLTKGQYYNKTVNLAAPVDISGASYFTEVVYANGAYDRSAGRIFYC